MQPTEQPGLAPAPSLSVSVSAWVPFFLYWHPSVWRWQARHHAWALGTRTSGWWGIPAGLHFLHSTGYCWNYWFCLPLPDTFVPSYMLFCLSWSSSTYMKNYEQNPELQCLKRPETLRNDQRCTSHFDSVKSNGHCLKSYRTFEVENATSAASFPSVTQIRMDTPCLVLPIPLRQTQLPWPGVFSSCSGPALIQSAF